MTIFSLVLKPFILDALKAKIENSQKKDIPPSDLSSNFISMFIPKRDTDLSREKQRLLIELVEQIENYYRDNTDNSDLKMTQVLMFYINQCRNQIDGERKKRSREPGTTDTLLEQLLKFVEQFHRKSTQFQLIDRADDQKAFALFLIAISSYCAQEIMDKVTCTPARNAFEHPTLSPIIRFRDTLNEQVHANLKFAFKNIDNLKKNSTEDIKNELGELLINHLILVHEKLHETYRFTPSSVPLPRYLGEYLTKAQHKLAETKQSSSIAPAIFDNDAIETQASMYVLPTEEQETLRPTKVSAELR